MKMGKKLYRCQNGRMSALNSSKITIMSPNTPLSAYYCVYICPIIIKAVYIQDRNGCTLPKANNTSNTTSISTTITIPTTLTITPLPICKIIPTMPSPKQFKPIYWMSLSLPIRAYMVSEDFAQN